MIQVKDLITAVKQQLSNRLDNHDQKFIKLLGGATDKNNKVNSFEKKIEDQLKDISSHQSKELERITAQIQELEKAFQEKIRRQTLVANAKGQAGNNSDEDIMTKLRKKPKFMAQQVAKELVMNGRLPQFENYGEHIARYGKGFS